MPDKVPQVTYIAIRDVSLPLGPDEVAWAVLLNGHLVAVDSDKYTSGCLEIAEGIASALGTAVKTSIVDVQPDWTWDDILGGCDL